MKTESCGLLDAAVIACFVLMELMLPLPLRGIIAQSAPTRAPGADAVGLRLGRGLELRVGLGLLRLGLRLLGVGARLRPVLPRGRGPLLTPPPWARLGP